MNKKVVIAAVVTAAIAVSLIVVYLDDVVRMLKKLHGM